MTGTQIEQAYHFAGGKAASFLLPRSIGIVLPARFNVRHRDPALHHALVPTILAASALIKLLDQLPQRGPERF
jgi:hypothetical protein